MVTKRSKRRRSKEIKEAKDERCNYARPNKNLTPTPAKEKMVTIEMKTKDSNKKAPTEEGGAEPPAATELRGVQVTWEIKPSWKTDSSKAPRALGGFNKEFQNNVRQPLKLVLSTSVLLPWRRQSRKPELANFWSSGAPALRSPASHRGFTSF